MNITSMLSIHYHTQADRGSGSYWVITSLAAIEKIPLSKAYFMYESCLLDMLQMLSVYNSKGLIGSSSPSLSLGAKFCFYQLPTINFVTGFFWPWLPSFCSVSVCTFLNGAYYR